MTESHRRRRPMAGERDGRANPLRSTSGRPTPAGLVADGIRRRREARQAVVRLHDADGLTRTLDLDDEASDALRRAAARCADIAQSDPG